MATKYDHVKEAEAHYANASDYRRRAAVVRTNAEKTARALESYADREVQQGLHIHRLCTSGSAFKCCCPPPDAVASLD
jgi:hypothetical protein